MKPNWNFQRGGRGSDQENLLMERVLDKVWIFSGIIHSRLMSNIYNVPVITYVDKSLIVGNYLNLVGGLHSQLKIVYWTFQTYVTFART